MIFIKFICNLDYERVEAASDARQTYSKSWNIFKEMLFEK